MPLSGRGVKLGLTRTEFDTNGVKLVMDQGLLPFKYELTTKSGMTALAGLPTFFELGHGLGMLESMEKHVGLRSESQGWSDAEQLMGLVLLNLAGGEHVEDLDRLEAESGLSEVMLRLRSHRLGRKKRRELQRRWRKGQMRAFASRSAALRYLKAFHDPAQEKARQAALEAGVRTFIPTPTAALRGLSRVCADLVAQVQRHHRVSTATLDQDATMAMCNKKEALYCYKGPKAYQPFNTWWAEQQLMVHTEFRDGNVPAGHEQLRCLQEALACLPEGVEKVYLRSDTAGYQHELMRYCAEGKDPRFKVIEFCIGCDVSPEFKAAVRSVKTEEWHPLCRIDESGDRLATHQEWAEVCFVPSEDRRPKDAVPYRYVAIREPMNDPELPGMEKKEAELPFPTLQFGSNRRRYKLFGMVTNRTESAEELIGWHRERCGKSEEVHEILKSDLAGGVLPSGDFGANAAWWWVTVLSFNLLMAMKRLALPEKWLPRRLKAIRFHLIALPGQVVRHARQLVVQLSGTAPHAHLLVLARKAIAGLLPAPAT